ncbi:SdrD B-like domain-containing protein [Glutamicibacter sp. NPDC087344]|uniref:SdrD B-like domain-containing protein n=1 Tax=Glutamicibacter sp. NPDC087344 TaxID=3363994 RepID=UPI0037FCAEEF
MREQRDLGAKKRLKPLLAAVLSLSLGVGMVGATPAFAAPDSETQGADTLVTTSPEPSTESEPSDSTQQPETEEPEASASETTTAPEEPAADEATDSEEPDSAESDKSQPATSAPKASQKNARAAAPSDATVGEGMFVEKSLISDPTVTPGNTVTYQVVVGCSSIEQPCIDAYMMDLLPEPLVLESLTYTGFAKPVTEEISDDKTQVKLIFNETAPDRPDTVGLNDGTDYTITVVAKLPEDADPKFNGQQLINKATLTSKTGSIENEAEPVVPQIDLAPKAEITKSWANDVLKQNSGAENTVTLGGIKNTSKVGATSLKITEPSGDAKPFDSVAFTGFGEIVYPEGATELLVTYYVGDEKHEATSGNAQPNAPPAFPDDLDLSTITGFELTFVSSASTESTGGIAANGTAGSIELNTTLRASEDSQDVTVSNETSIVAELPNGESSDPFKANDNFTVEATKYSVGATKSFTPNKDNRVVAGDPSVIGEGRNAATVKLGITNTSNQPLQTLTLKEPAEGIENPFGNGIDFTQFTAGTWPQGAESGVIVIGSDTYELTNNDGQIGFDGVPTGSAVTAFEITFTGEFQPGTGYNVEFGVVGVEAGDYVNKVDASGTYPGGETPVVVAEATLKVVDPVEANKSTKGFSPDRIEGIPGDETTATLSTHVDSSKANVDVRKIVQTDDFSNMVDAGYAPTTISVPQTQGANSVVVEVRAGNGEWTQLTSSDGSAIEETDVPSGTTAVQITYTRDAGTFPTDNDVQAKLGFQVIEGVVIDNNVKVENILGVNNDPGASGTIEVDKDITVTGGKRWESNSIVQKPTNDENPTNANPTSTLKLEATNGSTYGVNELSIVDPKDGEVNPFDFVNMTGFTATVNNDAAKALAHLYLYKGDEVLEFTGEAALNPVLEGRTWDEFDGFKFALLSSDPENLVARDVSFNISVGTQLRNDLRGSDPVIAIDDALADLNGDADRSGTGWVLPNTADAFISRGADEKTDSPKANLEITTDDSVDLHPQLTKKISPNSGVDFFSETGNPKDVNVELSVNSDTTRNNSVHKADYVEIVDEDPTFWNAFDFNGWQPAPSAGNAQTTIQYFTGATFESNDAGELERIGGGWTDEVPDNNQVQGIRVVFKGDNYAELPSNITTIKFNATPRYTLRSGDLIALEEGAVNPGEAEDAPLTVENTASASVSRLDKDHKTDDATDEVVFPPAKTSSSVDKTSDANNGRISAGGEVNYMITVKNTGTDAIVNPVITDILPSDDEGPKLILAPDWESTVEYSLDAKFNQAPEGTVVTTDRALISAVQDENKVVFSFQDGAKLYPGESYTIVLPTTVRAGLVAKSDLTNTVEFSGDNSETSNGGTGLDVIEGQAYASQKLVREVLTGEQTEKTGIYNVATGIENDTACYEFEGGFYRYPCIVETKPGGTAEWQLSVTNTGNVPAQHLEILDVFPHVGDTGVTPSQNTVQRGTVWVPTVQDIKLPEVPEGTEMTLYYLTGDATDCRPTGNVSNPWVGCEDGWTTERPANAKEINGLKLVLDFTGEGMQPRDSVKLSFTTTSETKMPDGAEPFAPAWNSFGYAAQAQVNGETDYRSQEPIKTGITFKPVEAAKVSVGDYVWFDEDNNGEQGDGEQGIKDVVLVLTGPNGQPVLDVYDNPVLPTMTDENGYYTFENLPVLEDGQSYTVTIDQEASKIPLAPYEPTIEIEGNREHDSSTWVATSEGLTTDDDRDPTLDFGFVLKPQMVSVGDYVWLDSNKDGLQDEDEKGIEGVVLKLVDSKGNPVLDVRGNEVAPATTDENGYYTFENLPVLADGDYYTVIIDQDASAEVLAPYEPTIETEDSRENDSSKWTANSEGLNTDGDRDPTLDFGFVLKPQKVSVGDYVWVDTNRDGLQDEGEPGIPGVVLTLVGPEGEEVTDVNGNPVGPVTTDEKGFYTFENLPVLKEGDSYTVKIDREASAEALKPYVPTITTEDSRENDSSEWEASSQGLTTDGDRDPTLDFGFVVPKVSVGDYVWVDTNRDGLQDEDEKGIEGVVLKLVGPDGNDVTDVNGNPVGPVTTDENGLYIFENLPVLDEGESYTVEIDRDASAEVLAPYVPTIETEDSRENDSSTWSAKSEGLNTNGEHDPTLDFGFVVPKVSVGDYVWVDSNKDGLQDEDEKGIEGVVLKLVGPDGNEVTDVNGEPVGPVTTDENGFYTFENLPVLEEGQSYTVVIDREASAEALKGYVPTIETEDSRENDSSTWEAKSEGLTNDGDRDPTLDFGFVVEEVAPVEDPKVSVGDYVWVDSNKDGIQDEDEKGIEGVVLKLVGPDGNEVTDVNGEPVLPTTTDKNGFYTFENLPVLEEGQSYTVIIDKDASADALKGYVPTKENGADRDKDSSTWEAKSEGLTNDGDRDPTLDFGFVVEEVEPTDPTDPTDPTQPTDPTDPTEPTQPTDPTDPTEPTQPTDPTDPTEPTQPTDPTDPTEPTQPTDPTDPTEPTQPTDPVEKPKVSVGDYVWVDSNKDGIQDEDEKGIEGVVLKIFGPDGKEVTDINGNPVGPVTTDENGFYTFEDLPVLEDGQSYTVVIDKDASADALKGYVPTKEGGADRDKDSSTWEAKSEGLTNDGDRDSTLDFGFVVEEVDPVEEPKVSVGDYVWVDTNKNGIQDEDEKGIEGVVLKLVGPDGKEVTDIHGNPVGPVTTDKNGYYTFEDLPVLEEGQSYTVVIDREASEDALKGYVPTKENGADRDKDSSTWEAKSEGLTNDGDRDSTLDFGFYLEEEEPVDPTPVDPTDPTPVDPTEPTPAESTDPTDSSEAPASSDSATESQDPSGSEAPKDDKDNLASTGFSAMLVLLAGLLLVAAGVMFARRNRGRHS